MPPSLCPAMAPIPSMSCYPCSCTPRACGGQGGAQAAARPGQPQLTGLPAVSWQQRFQDCGTLTLNERCAGGSEPHCWRTAAERRRVARVAGEGRKEPPLAGACTECGVLG